MIGYSEMLEEEVQDAGLPDTESAQKQTADEDGQVGERGAEVWLAEYEDEGQADQERGLADLRPGQVPADDFF